MNKKQGLVLLASLILICLALVTFAGSDFLFTTVNGRPVTLYDSSAIPGGVKWLVLAGLLLLTGMGLFRFRTVKRVVERPGPSGRQEGTWPPPPNTPVA